MRFEKNLRRLRKQRRWSQLKLAVAMRAQGVVVSASWVSAAEHGLFKSPKLATVRAAAEALGVTVEELMGEEEPSEETLTIRLRLKPGAQISDKVRQQVERVAQVVLDELAREGKPKEEGNDQ